MSEYTLVFAIMLLAVFTQSFIGFGSAMVAMSLLPAVIGLQASTPLFALITVIFVPFLVYYYREGLEVRAVWQLVLSNLFGIPVGILLLNWLQESYMLPVLGAIIFFYGLFALSKFDLPPFDRPYWSFVLGFISGVFGGAFAISGPPIIVYGHGRRWTPTAFKANLQAFFVVTSIGIVVGHLVNGGYTPDIWPYFRSAFPAMVLGVFLGIWLERYIQPAVFQKLVLVSLLLLGLGLVF